MKLGRLNHVGVAVPSMEAAIASYRDVLGASVITQPFDMPEQGVKVAFVNTPGQDGTAGTQIELIEPLGDQPDRRLYRQEPGRRAASPLL
jgi:methylmalonyl-CoA/ethylmalonyl-CoA epimerase